MARRVPPVVCLVLLCRPAGAAAPPPPSPPPPPSEAPPVARPAPPPAAAVGLPPLVAPLFTPKSTWRFTARVTMTRDDGRVQLRRRDIACRIADLRAYGDAVVSRVECRGDDALCPTALGGVFLATPAGLWLPDAAPADGGAVGELTAAKPVLAFPPAPYKASQIFDYAAGENIEVARADVRLPSGRRRAQWCVDRETYGGEHVSSSRLCFADGVGLVGAASSGGPVSYHCEVEVALRSVFPRPTDP